jgi:hypothetical protein
MLDWREIALAQDDFFDTACEILSEYADGKLYIAAIRGQNQEFSRLFVKYADDRIESAAV